MTLIETYPDESEASFRSAVEEYLSREFRGAKPRANWWHPFTVGQVRRWDGKLFREFQCVAGSVHCQLHLRAEGITWSRAVLMAGQRVKGALIQPAPSGAGLSAKLFVDGQERWIEPFDLED